MTPNLSRGLQVRDPNVRWTAMRAVSVDTEPEGGQDVGSERVTAVAGTYTTMRGELLLEYRISVLYVVVCCQFYPCWDT